MLSLANARRAVNPGLGAARGTSGELDGPKPGQYVYINQTLTALKPLPEFVSMIASPFGDVRMRGFTHRMEVARFQDLVRSHSAPLDSEIVPVVEGSDRILSESVVSLVDVPAFDRSAMDGYALRGEETFGAGVYNPLTFKVVGEVTPGQVFDGKVGAGAAVRIMTGAPIPEGCDAVLMAEYTREEDGVMTATEAVTPGRHVGRIGEDIRRGTPLFDPGRRIRPQDLGVLASIGWSELRVFRRPSVALLITGNELVKPGKTATGAMIVDSNSIMLRALVERDGGRLSELRHLSDDREAIREALLTVAGDLVITTGGSSVGIEDHAPSLIREEGQLLAHGVAMRPSAPTGLGRLADRLVFLLPGNPVSCLAAYDFFVGLAIRRLAGREEGWPYPCASYKLKGRIVSQIGRVDYARVKIEQGTAVLVATSGSSILSSTTVADGFVVVPQDSEGMPEGATVQVWLYDAPVGSP